jgi:hypothetical protein
MPSHIFGGVNVPQIDQDWASHPLLHLLEIERTELFPFGNNYHPVSSISARIRSIAVGDVGKKGFCLLHPRRVERAHLSAHILQGGNERN